VRGFPARVYVPNSQSNTVDVIDENTFKIVDHFAVGSRPQHVTPTWDMKRLWVDNDLGNSLTPVDPATGSHGAPVPVADPYNLYFTPDGTRAVVMAEAKEASAMRFGLIYELQLPRPWDEESEHRMVQHSTALSISRFALSDQSIHGSNLRSNVQQNFLSRHTPRTGILRRLAPTREITSSHDNCRDQTIFQSWCAGQWPPRLQTALATFGGARV